MILGSPPHPKRPFPPALSALSALFFFTALKDPDEDGNDLSKSASSKTTVVHLLPHFLSNMERR
jgi:hypothetical protein